MATLEMLARDIELLQDDVYMIRKSAIEARDGVKPGLEKQALRRMTQGLDETINSLEHSLFGYYKIKAKEGEDVL